MADFENAALVVFVALMTRVILTYSVDFTIPISKIHENMTRAQRRDSVRQEKFYFRVGDQIELMSIDAIINGWKDFPGLVPLAQKYLFELEGINVDTRLVIERYLLLISKRANGKHSSTFFF